MCRIALFLLAACLSFPLRGEERILSYVTNIDVKTDGDLHILEHITVRAEGTDIRRGIYRTFPTRYKDKLGNRYKVDFEVINVEKDGLSESYHTEEKNNGVVVYIGSEDKFLDPGIYRYTIEFRTSRQLGFFRDFDELYFNAIGGDWMFGIDTVMVTVNLPENAPVQQYAAYSGYAGSTDCNCEIRVDAGKVKFYSTSGMSPGEQFTVAVGWPKGYVAEPGAIQKLGDLLSDNFNLILGLTGLVLIFVNLYGSWKKVGVDPEKGVIIPQFKPPEGFTPAASRYLLRMGFDQRVFTASIVNMAVKGYILIRQDGKRDYTLERVSGDDSRLSTGEVAVATALFERGDEIALDQKNHKTFIKAKSGLQRALKADYQKDLFNVNTKYLLKPLLIGVVSILCMFWLAGGSPLFNFLFIFLYVALFILFAWLLKAPTLIGRKIMDYIEGFKMYLSVTEKDPLNIRHQPDITHEVFEKFLPFAIALGVENEWGSKFEKQLSATGQEAYAPAWYGGYRSGNFYPARFSSSLGGAFSSAISSSSTPPGSSSGSGGGGSSGGGGGGGGGGGW